MTLLGLWRRRFPVRLAVTTAALLALLMAALLAVAYTAVAALLIRQADVRALAELGARPGAGAPVWEGEEHGDEEGYGDEGRERHELDGRLEWSIHGGGPDGPRRASLAWLWPAPGDVRVARAGAGTPPLLVEELDEVAETLAGLRLWLIGLGAAGTVAVSGVAFHSARRAFAPLEQMLEAVSRVVETPRIRPDTLRVRVPPAQGDVTLERLADLFNAMMARVGDAMASQARFVDDASHELRTPLGALRAELEVALRQQQAAAPSCRDALERALAQVLRLSRLADELLALARYERGGTVRPTPGTDVVAAVRQALEDVRHLAERRDVTLVAELPEGLQADCDGSAISRLVTNLLRNAIEASPRDAQVTLRLAREGPQVVLEVTDSGPGMSPDEARRAFEPFFRAGRPGVGASSPGGAGLGLAIARAIVEAHGGRIELDSTPGRGTRVRVTLPAGG